MAEGPPKGLGASSQRDLGRNPYTREDLASPDSTSEFVKSLDRALHDAGVTLPPGATVVEIGSGAGVLLEALRQKGFDAVGIDLRPRGNSSLPQAGARLEQLPLADNSVDAFVSVSTFDSVTYAKQDQQAMLDELARALKEGGLYVSFSDVFDDGVRSEKLELIPRKRPSSLIKTFRKKPAQAE